MEIQFFEDTDRRELWLAQMKNCSWRAGRYEISNAVLTDGAE